MYRTTHIHIKSANQQFSGATDYVDYMYGVWRRWSRTTNTLLSNLNFIKLWLHLNTKIGLFFIYFFNELWIDSMHHSRHTRNTMNTRNKRLCCILYELLPTFLLNLGSKRTHFELNIKWSWSVYLNKFNFPLYKVKSEHICEWKRNLLHIHCTRAIFDLELIKMGSSASIFSRFHFRSSFQIRICSCLG